VGGVLNLDALRPANDPVLRTPAAEVPADQLAEPFVVDLVARMRAVMVDAVGVGLAAPQIGRGLAVCVLSYEGTELAWANPRVVYVRGRVRDAEGCLSLPDVGFTVARPAAVTVEAFDVDAGRPGRWQLRGWLARIACHEVDHLRGTLIDVACTRRRSPLAAEQPGPPSSGLADGGAEG
jgi:peptide deformylase